MKKILLFAVVALVAMTSSARRVNVDKSLKKSVMKEMFAHPEKTLDNVAAKASTRAAGDSLAFVEISADWLDDEEGTYFAPCAGVYVVKSGETVDYNGEKMEKVTVVGICAGEATVSGYMNDSKIIIPSQKCVVSEADQEEYGDMILMTYYLNEEGTGVVKSDADIVFENDGNGYYTVADPKYYGIVMQMTGDYAKYVWTSAPYADLAQANGKMTMMRSKGGWEAVEAPIYAQNGEDGEVVIYNAYDAAAVNMYVQEDSTVLIPTHQIIAATSSSSVDQAVYGYSFRLLSVDVTEEGKLHVNEETEYIPAVMSDAKTIAYEDGAYSAIFTNFDADGSGYYKGYQTRVTFTLNEGSFPTAIDEIKSNDKKDNAIYNIAGQRVEKAQKGLYIIGGQKVLVK